MTVSDVEVSQIPDGTYIGEWDVDYIHAKVKVTVSRHKLTERKGSKGRKNYKGYGGKPVSRML